MLKPSIEYLRQLELGRTSGDVQTKERQNSTHSYAGEAHKNLAQILLLHMRHWPQSPYIPFKRLMPHHKYKGTISNSSTALQIKITSQHCSQPRSSQPKKFTSIQQRYFRSASTRNIIASLTARAQPVSKQGTPNCIFMWTKTCRLRPAWEK